MISDHYQPWLESQGHSGYAWSILGAAAQATERIPLMTLSNNRFRLGLGGGENLNEHIAGHGWPSVGVRHELLSEAVEVIAVEPREELGAMFDEAGGAGKSRVGQIAIAYHEDRDAAVQRAHEQFRWFGLG